MMDRVSCQGNHVTSACATLVHVAIQRVVVVQKSYKHIIYRTVCSPCSQHVGQL